MEIQQRNKNGSDISPYFNSSSSFSFGPVAYLINMEHGIALILNTFLILFLMRNKKLRKKHSNIYLFSLFATYILMALSNFILQIIQEINNNHIIFRLSVSSLQTSCIAGSLSLILVTIDRFIAVKYPFRFQEETRKKAFIVTILIVWLPSVLIFLCAVTKSESIYIKFLAKHVIWAIATAMVTLILANIYNVVTVCKIKRSRRGTSSNSEFAYRIRSNKVVYVSFAMVFVHIVNWTPDCVILFLSVTGRISLMEELEMMLWTIPLVSANGVLGPLAYVAFTQNFRKEIKKWLKTKRFNDVVAEKGISGRHNSIETS